MRSMIFVVDTLSNSGTGDEMEKINSFNDELRANGNFIMAAGLAEAPKATVIDNTSTPEKITPGSIFDQAEFFSGFWIIETENPDQARMLASKASKACNRKVELRPFL
jgi:hypothetical protein